MSLRIHKSLRSRGHTEKKPLYLSVFPVVKKQELQRSEKKRKPVFILLLFVSLFFLPAQSFAQKTFDFNARCEQAYHQILMLKTDAGQRILNEEKKAHPDNLIPYFLENYIDLFTLFFDENPKVYEERRQNRDHRLNLMEQGPKNSPYYLFTKAMIHIQWGFLKLKFGDNVSAIWDFRHAYLEVQENDKKFPDFSPNKIILGSMQALIGTIPSGYRWVTHILGFTNGSVIKGIALLHSYINDHSRLGRLFKEEAYFYYVYLKFYIQHRPDEAMQFIKEKNLDIANNALYAFMTANLALNNHQSAFGMQVLENLEKGPEYVEMPILDYEMGTMKLYHLELDDAIYHFKRFIQTYTGKFYIKDALFKLSWCYYLKGDMKQAKKYQKLVESEGNTVVDADKVALREAQKNGWPDPTILKARMLMTGGYFQDALKMLKQKDIEDYHDLLNKIEYAYFLGRINDEMGRDDKAILLYRAAIKGGSKRPEYYAARAALQTAFIYEQRKDTAKALEYFHKCLNMQEEEYKRTLDQRAKAGINRLTVQ